MRRLYKGLILAAAIAPICSVAAWVKATRDLQAARREFAAVITANEFLRNTLGEMTLAMTAKDREIDRLEHAGCNGPGARKASRSGALPRENSRKNSRLLAATEDKMR